MKLNQKRIGWGAGFEPSSSLAFEPLFINYTMLPVKALNVLSKVFLNERKTLQSIYIISKLFLPAANFCQQEGKEELE